MRSRYLGEPVAATTESAATAASGRATAITLSTAVVRFTMIKLIL